MAGISHEGPEPDRKPPQNPTVPDDAADTDEEEFHDARFPAEEEAVCRAQMPVGDLERCTNSDVNDCSDC